jgi:hypothetical protein
MNDCIRFPAYARVVTDEEMQALARKRGAVLAWMAERQRAKDERQRRLEKARADAFEALCRKPLPANVTRLPR